VYIVCGPSIWYEEDLDWFRIERGTGVVVATRDRDRAQGTAAGYLDELCHQYSLDDIYPRDAAGVRSMEELVSAHTTVTEVCDVSREVEMFIVCGPRSVRREGSDVVVFGSSVWGVHRHEEVLSCIRRGCESLLCEMRDLGADAESIEWERRGLGGRINVERLVIQDDAALDADGVEQ
jgi:hypothetical protein